MEKFRQYRFLKKVEKLLNAPAPADEIYTTTADAMYVGATAPRTAGHFADSAVAVRQGQVKGIAGMVGELIGLLEKENGGGGGGGGGGSGGEEEEEEDGEEEKEREARFVEIEVRFQELEMGLLFTEQEVEARKSKAVERRMRRRRRRREKAKMEAGAGEAKVAAVQLGGMRERIARWQKEQMERKRRLYKIETTVRDLGVNINDVRCRALESDRRAALANLKGNTDAGVRMLREVVGELEGASAGSGAGAND